jgi:uncharacterized membrane protein (UPF0136 family)
LVIASASASAYFLPAMHPIAVSLLWVFIAVLVAGGLMGFLKAKSKASLIASIGSALPLVLVALGVLPGVVAVGVFILLQALFFVRFRKSGRFMPSGMLLGLSVLMEAVMVYFVFIAKR